MKILPAIDLIEGKTVRLKQGEYDKKLSYDITPVDAARKWESMGAEILHVVDLDGARVGVPQNLDTAKEIVKAVNIPIEIGGGYRTKDDIQRALDAGASRVIVGSKAFEDEDFAAQCVEEFGDKVIFSVDVKNLKVSVRGWKETVGTDVQSVVKRFKDMGAGQIIYTDIKSDGMLSGPNIPALRTILEAVDIKIISAGGVTTVDDIKKLKQLESKGLSGAIIGRALYEGTIDLKEAIDAGKADSAMS